jgi:hypothetical protein
VGEAVGEEVGCKVDLERQARMLEEGFEGVAVGVGEVMGRGLVLKWGNAKPVVSAVCGDGNNYYG